MAKHHRKHKASGGEAGEKDFGAPRDDWKEEESSKPPVYAGGAGKVPDEAEEKKKGGRAKRKRGGATKINKHHESGEDMKHAKHLGKVKGEQHFPNAGRAPRKSGGRTGSNFSPLSSAHAGEAPKGHRTTEID